MKNIDFDISGGYGGYDYLGVCVRYGGNEDEANILLDKIKQSLEKIEQLKTVLEQFDMNREHGYYPENYEEFIDDLAKIVWENIK